MRGLNRGEVVRGERVVVVCCIESVRWAAVRKKRHVWHAGLTFSWPVSLRVVVLTSWREAEECDLSAYYRVLQRAASSIAGTAKGR